MPYWILLVLFLFGCQNLQTPPVVKTQPQTLSILQGSTDETTTVINILAPKDKKYDYQIYLDKSRLKTPDLIESHFASSNWKVINIPLSRLHPGATYKLTVRDKQKIIDERTFTTLAKKLNAPKIAVISCTDDSYTEIQKQQWNLVKNKNPDLLFLIGDNVYVDNHIKRSLSKITEVDILERYIETRLALEVFQWKHLTPIFATWDDHDFGKNNAHQSFEFKDQSKYIFQVFFPMVPTKTIQKGPGVSSLFSLGKTHFIFLDNRYFRSEKLSQPESHFGKEQEQWVSSLLKSKKGAFALISGDQFFGGYHPFESYQGDHPQAFENFLKMIQSHKKPVYFISGDRHIAEVMKIPKKYLGYSTYEFTSSGLHTKMYPGSLEKTPNPLALFNKDGEHHFLILQPLEASRYKVKIKASYYGENARHLFEEILDVQL